MSEPVHPGVRPSRCQVAARARLRLPGAVWETGVEDLSASGALLTRPPDFTPEVGAMASVEFFGTEFAAIRLQARAVRVDEDRVAFVFEGLGPSQEQELRDLISAQGALKDGLR